MLGIQVYATMTSAQFIEYWKSNPEACACMAKEIYACTLVYRSINFVPHQNTCNSGWSWTPYVGKDDFLTSHMLGVEEWIPTGQLICPFFILTTGSLLLCRSNWLQFGPVWRMTLNLLFSFLHLPISWTTCTYHHAFYMVVGIEPKVMCSSGKHCANGFTYSAPFFLYMSFQLLSSILCPL